MIQYIVTERAHLMCPNMHFGIKARIAASYDKEKVQTALEALTSAHPFLKSNIAQEPETGKLYYCWREYLQIPVYEKEDVSRWPVDYTEITKYGWDAFHECLLKLVIYPDKESFEVLFIAHHLLGDGRSILNLVCEFADCYASGKCPAFAEENLISSINDLPEGSQLSAISKLIVGYANRKWKREGHSVSRDDFQHFEKKFLADNPVSYTEETWDAAKVEALLTKCREHGVSLNDYLVAEMMCRENTNRVVAAVDIRKHLSRYHPGALGNYASATAIELSKVSDDIWAVARLVSDIIRRNIRDPQRLMMILACYLYMEPDLIDAAAISVLGAFPSKAGRFVGSLILGYQKCCGYSVTNLGNVDHPYILEAMFIPPASPANAKTTGVLSVNHRLKKCTAYYQ